MFRIDAPGSRGPSLRRTHTAPLANPATLIDHRRSHRKAPRRCEPDLSPRAADTASEEPHLAVAGHVRSAERQDLSRQEVIVNSRPVGQSCHLRRPHGVQCLPLEALELIALADHPLKEFRGIEPHRAELYGHELEDDPVRLLADTGQRPGEAWPHRRIRKRLTIPARSMRPSDSQELSVDPLKAVAPRCKLGHDTDQTGGRCTKTARGRAWPTSKRAPPELQAKPGAE